MMLLFSLVLHYICIFPITSIIIQIYVVDLGVDNPLYYSDQLLNTLFINALSLLLFLFSAQKLAFTFCFDTSHLFLSCGLLYVLVLIAVHGWSRECW